LKNFTDGAGLAGNEHFTTPGNVECRVMSTGRLSSSWVALILVGFLLIVG
jgi:hypothetical protein